MCACEVDDDYNDKLICNHETFVSFSSHFSCQKPSILIVHMIERKKLN